MEKREINFLGRKLNLARGRISRHRSACRSDAARNPVPSLSGGVSQRLELKRIRSRSSTRLILDFRFACRGWPRYTPENRRAHEIVFVAPSSRSEGRHFSPRRRVAGWRSVLPGHSFDTALHLCPRFAKPAFFHAPRVNLPGPGAPRSAGASSRTGFESGGSLPTAARSSGRA